MLSPRSSVRKTNPRRAHGAYTAAIPPREGVDLEASCIEGGLQVGYSPHNAWRDYPRLAAPAR